MQHISREDFEKNVISYSYDNMYVDFRGAYTELLAFKNGFGNYPMYDISILENDITEYLKKNNVPKTGNKPLATQGDKSGIQKEISDVKYTLNWAENANTSDWSNTDKQLLNDYVNSLNTDLIELNFRLKLEILPMKDAQTVYNDAYAEYLESLKSSGDNDGITGGGSSVNYLYGDMFYLRGLLQKHNVLQPTTNNSSNSNTGSNGANSNTNNSSASSATNSTINGTTHDSTNNSTNNSMTNTNFGANNNTGVVTAADVAKKAQIANLSNEQSSNQMKTLPQTGEKNQDNMAVSGILGLIAAMLGFVGISFRKRRN
ncbi:LPXTG cell wall anchor domain-containing protein [Pediococcus pentosaceus]